MEYKEIQNTSLRLSAISFGAWAIGGWMWGGSDRSESIKAIKKSIELGVTTIDTAPIYGFGLSEEIVAESLKGVLRNSVQILTKFGMIWESKQGQLAFHSKDNHGNPIDIYKYASKESVIIECEASLRRLNTDYIDLYQLHWPADSSPIEETMEALQILKDQGKIIAGSVCNFSAEQMKAANKFFPIASNQVPYSMLNRGIESDVVPYCIENHKGILAYSPLQRGILSGRFNETTTFKEGDHRQTTKYYSPENIHRINAFLEKLKPLAQSKGATLSQLVIRWTINQPGITSALVGARNAAQADENAKAIHIHLNEEDQKWITNELSQLILI